MELTEQLEFAAHMLCAGMITQDQHDQIVASLYRAQWSCAACNTNVYPQSAMQPGFCTECVQAMLHGRNNRLDNAA